MLDVNTIFNEERKLEKETIALINYFRLILTFNISADATANYEYASKIFTILSEEYLKRLVVDCKEGNIDIYTKTWKELLEQLKENLNVLNKGNRTKSIFVLEAIESGNMLINYFENNVDHYRTTIFQEYLTNETFKSAFADLNLYSEKLAKVSIEYMRILESLEPSQKLAKVI